MNLNHKSTKLSLDWDNINLQDALVRFLGIIDSPNTKSAVLSRSARKGYNCRINTLFPVLVAKYRFNLGDDPRRLLHDLFNRPDHVHDILWNRKTVNSIPHEAHVLIQYNG